MSADERKKQLEDRVAAIRARVQAQRQSRVIEEGSNDEPTIIDRVSQLKSRLASKSEDDASAATAAPTATDAVTPQKPATEEPLSASPLTQAVASPAQEAPAEPEQAQPPSSSPAPEPQNPTAEIPSPSPSSSSSPSPTPSPTPTEASTPATSALTPRKDEEKEAQPIEAAVPTPALATTPAPAIDTPPVTVETPPPSFAPPPLTEDPPPPLSTPPPAALSSSSSASSSSTDESPASSSSPSPAPASSPAQSTSTASSNEPATEGDGKVLSSWVRHTYAKSGHSRRGLISSFPLVHCINVTRQGDTVIITGKIASDLQQQELSSLIAEVSATSSITKIENFVEDVRVTGGSFYAEDTPPVTAGLGFDIAEQNIAVSVKASRLKQITDAYCDSERARK